MSSSKRNHKEKIVRRNKEEKAEEAEVPKYRDRAKERREDQNPDYELTELGAFHAVAPPGNVDVLSADAQKLSIEKSKYLGGDVEHTHLVKGLDYALLHQVRSEIDKKPDAGDGFDGKPRGKKEEQLSFRTATARSVYQWIIKPQTVIKTNEMFLPGRMAFIFNMHYFNDIPTTLHRSKADCPVLEEMVTVSVDGSVLDRIAKIMSYLRLGSSGKVLKKKKKEKDGKGKTVISNGYDDVSKSDASNSQNDKETVPPSARLPKENHSESRENQGPAAARNEEDDIFIGEGVDYIPAADMGQSPDGYDAVQAQALAGVYQPEWQDYQYSEQLAYPEQYLQQNYDMQAGVNVLQDPHLMTQEEKDRGLGSVFKRDDQRLLQLRERDAREKDPNFISESYSECYPGYQEYNREIVDSDDEADLSKMDMGGRAKGKLHRWDFETEEEWATYNEQKEAMPKAAFQFGVKMQDGRKTRKQNKDQKLTNELHKINKILTRKKAEKDKGEALGTVKYNLERSSAYESEKRLIFSFFILRLLDLPHLVFRES
ncbi:unnamed protein product [Withania somnifera]